MNVDESQGAATNPLSQSSELKRKVELSCKLPPQKHGARRAAMQGLETRLLNGAKYAELRLLGSSELPWLAFLGTVLARASASSPAERCPQGEVQPRESVARLRIA